MQVHANLFSKQVSFTSSPALHNLFSPRRRRRQFKPLLFPSLPLLLLWRQFSLPPKEKGWMDHGEGKKGFVVVLVVGVWFSKSSARDQTEEGVQLNCPSDREGEKTTLLGWASNIIFFVWDYLQGGGGKKRTQEAKDPRE